MSESDLQQISDFLTWLKSNAGSLLLALIAWYYLQQITDALREQNRVLNNEPEEEDESNEDHMDQDGQRID